MAQGQSQGQGGGHGGAGPDGRGRQIMPITEANRASPGSHPNNVPHPIARAVPTPVEYTNRPGKGL
jgi:hypothetical protein